MAVKTLKIAVVSDLHCHPKRKREDGNDETYLLTDKLRSPTKDHPVDNLVQIIKKENIQVDLTLCPGDFTDKANVQGFISGWGFSLELNRELSSQEIIATVGNHDVDAYNNISNYSLTTAKGIKCGFPIDDASLADTFWSKGCVFVEKASYRILVINSSHYHHNKASASSGKVGDDLLEYIESYLANQTDDKINIAMSHHHPIDHSRYQLGEHDKIVNADELLSILGKYKFDLYVHGHKHDPMLRYYNPTGLIQKIPIFSSGSFSACSNLMFTSIRNTFHIIEIVKDTKSKGTIKTWTFSPHTGWQIILDQTGFAPYCGFGNEKPIKQLQEEITSLLEHTKSLEWATVTKKVEGLDNLLPSELHELSELLKAEGYLLDGDIWLRPEKIYNIKSLQ